MERCTAEHKSATDGERCTTEPIEATRGDALLKRKPQEEIRPHQDQDFPNPSATDIVSVAAAVEVTEPMVVDLANAAVSEPQAEGGIQEAVSEPQAEYTDGYEDDNEYDAEAEGDYEDDAEYDDEAEGEDDYDYGSDYEEEEYDYGPMFEEERPKVRAVLSHFPETANLEPHELDAAVERILEQSKPEYADVAGPGKMRLLTADIEQALDPWTPPPPSIIRRGSRDGLPADLILKLEELDKEWEEVEKELLPLYDKPDEELERFRAKVRTELIHKGYVAVDEDYYEKKDELERQFMDKLREEWDQKMYPSRFSVVASNEDGICYYSEEHGGYI
ncbi:hypothetical protein ACQ4PT_025214 [Festuca glaucescens]